MVIHAINFIDIKIVGFGSWKIMEVTQNSIRPTWFVENNGEEIEF